MFAMLCARKVDIAASTVQKTTFFQKELERAAKEMEDKENFVHKPSASVWEFRENPAEDWLKKGSDQKLAKTSLLRNWY